MSLPTVWPIRRPKDTLSMWKCTECPPMETPLFTSIEDLDKHRLEAETIRIKRELFRTLSQLGMHHTEEEE